MKPFIYSVADDYYMRTYAPAFINSARAQGHDAEVFLGTFPASTGGQKLRYCTWRFELMPDLLKKYPAVLMLDVDSVIKKPFEVDDEFDLGIYVRNEIHELTTRTLGGIFYCTPRGAGFADALARDMAPGAKRWCDDQAVLWKTYAEHRDDYRIKLFDRTHLDWEPNPKARVLTGKGDAKQKNWFRDELTKWTNHKVKAA
jgi:hypothetical protein